MPQFAGGIFNVGAIVFPYDAYDDIVLARSPKAFWKLEAKTSVTYDAYDDIVLARSPKAFWKLESIDSA